MSKIWTPDGQTPQQEQPQTSAIVMQTGDGKTIAFPQVAVAVITPDVINLIAQAVVERVERNAVMQPDGQFLAEEPPTEQAYPTLKVVT